MKKRIVVISVVLFFIGIFFVFPSSSRAQYTYTVSGTVFIDSNPQDQVQDNGEAGYNSGGVPIISVNGLSAATDASGHYSISGIPPSGGPPYNVTLSVPGGYMATTPTTQPFAPPPPATINFGIRPIPTYTITAHINSVTDPSSCPSGNPYAFPVSINVSGGSLPPSGITNNTSTGTTSFSGLPNGNYILSFGNPPLNYKIVGRQGGVNSGQNAIAFNNLSSDQVGTYFCIAAINPWFQTDLGDARFLALSESVPSGKSGSIDANYPGIFYSSTTNVDVGAGIVSSRNWQINKEYDYNSGTSNRNGSMSYDFYESKIKQDGIATNPIPEGTLVPSNLSTGVYEVGGGGNVTGFGGNPISISGKRIVILAKGNVTIDQPIRVDTGSLFIVASKGDITIAKTVGVAYNTDYALLTPLTHSIDGYYSSEGNIIALGDGCPDGTTPDLRLNVGGALIANALKPFSANGGGTVQNLRSVCAQSVNYPSLFIASRPDFLLQMTDFYKTSYTKWQEVNP